MLNKEKIMHGLQCCAGVKREYGCDVCDYYEKDNIECSDRLALEALELLKEQDNEIDTLKTLLLGYEIGAIKGNN